MNKLFLLSAGALMIAAVQPASAADLAVKAPVYKAPQIVAYDWNGFYVGGNVGYSWGRARSDDPTSSIQVYRAFGLPAQTLLFDSGTLIGDPLRTNVDGWVGGLQTGWNVQRNAWLWGIETDFQASGERGSVVNIATTPAIPVTGLGTIPPLTASLSMSEKLKWFGTLRARVGWLPTDRWVVYATGGLAYGKLSTGYSASIAGLGAVSTAFDQTRAGYVVGGGIEGALWGNWTAKAEYLYMDLGHTTSGAGALAGAAIFTGVPATGFTTVVNGSVNTRTRFTDNIVRLGLNYHFHGGPVVAKY